ncbi:hypothetical protein QF001_004363 [Paraburkholderia youngii]|uniref:hypothetical protein n=1 Tax=Paraburkholderia youngii TaxID=2782701 RepID=UPI003D24AA28
MDWIPALLKHLAIARSGVVAAFVTTAVFLFVPLFAPNYLPKLSANWSPALIGVFLFSGCLLSIWGLEATSAAAKRIMASAKASRGLKASLDDIEASLIYALGCNPAEPINLDTIGYASGSTTRLELMEVVSGLSDKGLVDENPFARKLVSLTANGRKRALELHRIHAAKK